MIEAKIDACELAVAEVLNAKRQEVNAKNGVHDRRQAPEMDYSIEIGGFGAEIAVAKYLNVTPDLTQELKKGSGDMMFRGWKIDSKWTYKIEGTMNVVPWKKKNPADIYFLVAGPYPNYYMVGWAWGTEVFQDKYLHTFKGTYYRVPQKDLHPVEGIWEIGTK